MAENRTVKRAVPQKSYGEVVRSSSIIGGSKVVVYLIQLIRMKSVAVLLGPSGVGFIGIYQSALKLLRTISGLGINQSGVRDVAQSVGKGNQSEINVTISVLRKVCWLTGAFGLVLSLIAAWPMSWWLFESDEHVFSIALLGVGVFLTAVSAGQLAVLQGMRRLKELAVVGIQSAAVGSVLAVGIYFYFGKAGIVPAMVVLAAINLLFSWRAVRKVSYEPVKVDWTELWVRSKTLLALGATFMWGVLLAAVVTLVLKGEISRGLGVEAAGLYHAAWGLSGLFATFIIQAMGTDFYPRLTGVIDEKATANRYVGEQIEVGLLFALPGLIGTITLAPLLVTVLYSKEFLECVELLMWLAGGILLRVVGWPVGMIPRAKGAVKCLLFTMTWGHACNLVFSLIFMHYFGLRGVGIGFLVFQSVQLGIGYLVGRSLTGFRWSKGVLQLSFLALAALAVGLPSAILLEGYWGSVTGFLVTSVVGLVCLRALATRLGPEHRIVKKLAGVPVLQRLC